MLTRLPVAILGATGVVGQRLVQLLDRHPWFELIEVCGSERSVGKLYRDAVSWRVPSDLPEAAARLRVCAATTELEAVVVFSALDAAAAHELEPLHAGRGRLVVSNASAFRMDPDVPLVIPEVNPQALALLERQRFHERGGGIVTNPNCSAVGLTLALAPLHAAFGVEAVVVTTLQALSGAGHPGIASLDAVGNVVPYIAGEEEKIAAEPCRILGAEFPISVAVHRVPVVDGHTEAVFVKLRDRISIEDIARTLRAFRGSSALLPSAPERPLLLRDEPDRPQPVRDVERHGGMVVTVGRLRSDPIYDARFTLLVHNTLRGAAGAAVLNAELLAATGRVRCAEARGFVQSRNVARRAGERAPAASGDACA